MKEEILDSQSGQERLARSRAALLNEMGIATTEIDSVGSDMQPDPAHSVPRPSPWLSMGKRVAQGWWAHHPANAALTLAMPALQRYARTHPGHTIAYGAAAGAALFILRPWRLLSITTLAALLIRRSSVAALMTSVTGHVDRVAHNEHGFGRRPSNSPHVDA